MEKERCAYTRFSFDKNKQNSETYTDRKADMENVLRNIEKDAKMLELGPKMLSVDARFNDTYDLSICRYKDRMFIGLKDRNTKDIIYQDTSNSLVKMQPRFFEQLETRMHNAMTAWANKGVENIMVKDSNKSWEQQLLMLDKIIAFEEKFAQLSPTQQRIYANSKLYDQTINEILENGEKALLDKNRLPAGRQTPETSKSTSLKERFQRARNEASAGKINTEKTMKKDGLELG